MKLSSAFVILVWLLGVVGWCMNIYFIVVSITATTIGELQLTVMLVLRIVGIFVAPLGAILGYIPG